MAKSYILPFALYLIGTAAAAQADRFYPLAYTLVVVVVAVVSCRLLWSKDIIRPHGRLLAATAVGIVGIALWIWLSQLKLEELLTADLPEWLRPADRVSFNPFDQFTNPFAMWGFIAIRMVGLVVLVPIAEELFWRGFLLRWLIDPQWEEIPLGRFTAKSFCVVVLLFTLAHPEWLAAAVYCMLLNGLLYWKRDLWTCIVAHAVSNLLLAIYVLATDTWWLW